MEELTVFSEVGIAMPISCIYYFHNSNYYLIYTTKEIDENGYVVLHFAKIICEVDPTTNLPQLYGVELTNEEEWKNVQGQINSIVEDKKSHANNAVHYLDSKNLNNLKIKSSRTFRLRPDIMKEVFNIDVEVLKGKSESIVSPTVAPVEVQPISNLAPTEGFVDYKTKYLEQLNTIKQLETELNEYKQKINDIKNVIE